MRVSSVAAPHTNPENKLSRTASSQVMALHESLCGRSKYSRIATLQMPVRMAGPKPANHAVSTVANMKSANGAVVSHNGAMSMRTTSVASTIATAMRYRWIGVGVLTGRK